ALTPVFDGLKSTRDLPQACTLNGKCAEVCPVEIPLPTLLRGWRDRSWRDGLEPMPMRLGIGFWAWAAQHPSVYRLGSRVAVRVMRLFKRGGWIQKMPMAGGWTNQRDLLAPERETFLASSAARERRVK
ncbi:MAG: lactate utilization protein LutB domain-containing protein, partial [Burkholderiaceae bacterium]